MRVLITGSAGFIGFHLAQRLLAEGHSVVGIDGITPYYDQNLKRQRHAILGGYPRFTAHEIMLEDTAAVAGCVASAQPIDAVVHLAAQAGVRYSLENPRAYLESNVVGTFNLLDALRQTRCRHVLVASTSSVYGDNPQAPSEETHSTDSPVSFYAATKKATELLAYDYARTCNQPTTVVRLFTVYGPWGRPDMALFKFTRNIIEGAPIEVYGRGRMSRDFTYIDDAIESIRRLIDRPPPDEMPEPGSVDRPQVPYRAVNVGSGRPVELETFISLIETELDRKAVRHDMPMQPGDVAATFASTTRLQRLTGYTPATPIAAGISNFVAWYRQYYLR
jgi:UDP-glucuronate 4-epimerase